MPLPYPRIFAAALAVLSSLPAGAAAQAAAPPKSLAEAARFFKAPPLDGCAITVEELVKGGSQALRGQWELRKGPGERALVIGSRVEMVPVDQQPGELLAVDFRGGRLTADAPALGHLPVHVADRAPPEPGSGLRAESAGRGDLADGAEVHLDEIALAPLPCAPAQMLRLTLALDEETGSGEVLRHEYRLFLIDQSRMGGTYRVTGPGGRIERGLATLLRR